jgi:hypothetical protein
MSLRRIGALWRPTKEGSKAALSGTLSFLGEDVRIIVLKNEHKKGPRDPDYLLHRSIADDGQKGNGGRSGDGGEL